MATSDCASTTCAEKEREKLKKIFSARKSVHEIRNGLYEVDSDFIYNRSRAEIDADLAEIGLKLVSFNGLSRCYSGFAKVIE